MPTKSITPTELPVLNAENFAEAIDSYLIEPVPDEYQDAVRSALEEDSSRTVFERKDITDNGRPTRWMVLRTKDGDLEWGLWDKLPCSVPWCVGGHDADESDTWDELIHRTEERKVDGIDSCVQPIRQAIDDEAQVYIYLDIEGEVTLADIPAIQAQLVAYSDLLTLAVAEAKGLSL